jgi:hypothetical protein
MVEKSHRHRKRIGKSSGFVIHFRGAGVDQETMDRIILDYFRKTSDLLRPNGTRTDFNARMGIDAIARGDYLPDRTSKLEGISAYIREKLKYMKDLGLIRRDDFTTHKMSEYVRILESGDVTAKKKFLQDRVAKWKLISPQGARTRWTPRQNGYLHYRIRPGIMLLYAIKCAERQGVEIDTDDLMLSALRFFTPKENSCVDEDFIKEHIENYFKRKARSIPDYESEFVKQMQRVETDLGIDLREEDPHAFSRKCRNAANDAYCLIIFMRNAGVMNTENRNNAVGHWSATQQAYESTPRVPEFNVLSLTDAGKHVLEDSLKKEPIWYEDIQMIFLEKDTRTRMAFLVNELAQGGNLSSENVTAEEIEQLHELHLEGSVRGSMFIPEKLPVFELQYDMP